MPVIAILIPARRASTRLPDKLLQDCAGTPLLIHTCRRAAAAFGREAVTVACDDPALVAVVTGHGFRAMTTRSDHQSGSSRLAEAAARIDATTIVNVQGDEPEIDPEHIRGVAGLLEQHPWAGIATLATSGTAADQVDPAAVKVLLAAGDRALAFTRAPCPWDREAGAPATDCHRHIGIYAYRREVLLGWPELPASRLEALERLEQLRPLEAGIGIACAVVDHAAPGIDTPSDLAAFRARLEPAP